jgi:Ulp1 family protease
MAFITDIWGTTQFFHYDSMGNYHNSDDLLALVAEYIRALRFPIPYPDPPAAVDLSGGNFFKLKGPIQPNSYDCGIYALKFIQTILTEIKSESADRYLSHSFNASVWTQIDVNSYRDEMFNAGSMIYQEHVVDRNMQETQTHVREIEESRNSTRHKSMPDVDGESKGRKKVPLEIIPTGIVR